MAMLLTANSYSAQRYSRL